uniref:Carbonic anhydrase n=1 Tax=Kalanchoe fedtschenkoi TaxID=63787 RepID=A0A7N0SYZ7_KALFE
MHSKMAARFRFFLLGLALLACFATVANSHEEPKVAAGIDFSYLGSSGPEKWGSMNSKYALCANGKTQSPINIVTDDVVKNKKLKSLVRDYQSTNATLINNGYNLGMKFNPDVGTLKVDGKEYSLIQMHWHTPSEHQIDGEEFPAEIHLVHMEPEHGTLAVVGILFKYGSSDPVLNKLKDELEELAKEKCQEDEEARIPVDKVNIKYLRKTNKKFYRYIGSLTTPPCSESVVWNILTKVKTISKEQVELLQAPLDSSYKKNCRPVQPLNGRKVEVYQKGDDDDDEDD